MLIFGWGHVSTKNYGATLALSCPNCKNDTWMQLSRHRTWFTLFFIPVIPYSKEHVLFCEVCSQGLELEGEQIQRAKQMNELTQGLFNDEIPNDQYWQEAEKIEVFA